VKSTLFLFVLALAGCIGGSSSGSKPPEQPFMVIEPHEARLLAAAQSVTRNVGHDVAYEVDAALLKEHAPRISEAMSDALETIARGIEQARATRPDITSRACAALTKLVIQSNDKLREPDASFDPKVGTLVLRVPSGVMSFTTERTISSAILATEAD
jgi:hypothetical protein